MIQVWLRVGWDKRDNWELVRCVDEMEGWRWIGKEEGGGKRGEKKRGAWGRVCVLRGDR